jgi:IS30 family transposase
MVKSRELTEFQRIEIIRLSETGLSQRKVAEVIGCCQNTVKTTLQRFKKHNTVKSLHRTGRNPISNERDKRNLIDMVKKDPRLPASKLALEWCLSNGKHASPSHVQKVLQQNNCKRHPACTKPRLTNKQHSNAFELSGSSCGFTAKSNK